MSNPYAQSLPAQPNLEQQKKRAKDLLKALKAGEPEAIARLRYSHPRHTHCSDGDAGSVQLADAQLVIAREYGFSAWPRLKAHIDALNGSATPDRPFETDPQYYRDRAYGLLSTHQTGERGAARILLQHLPRLAGKSEEDARAAVVTQAEAELVVAREHGFPDFASFEAHLKRLESGEATEPFRDAFKAIMAGDAGALSRVLDAHPEIVNLRGANGNRLLNLGGHRIELMKILLERGADPNLGNNKGSTPLHDAAYGGGAPGNAVERIELLLAAGADPTLETYGEGGTPLAMALFWGHLQAAERLAREGVTPCNLRTCAGLGRLDLMAHFFEPDGQLRPEAGWRREFHRPHSGFPPWRPSDSRQEILDEALTYAARCDQTEAMEFLRARGANLNAEPYCGTPLAWAVRTGRVKASTWLLTRGAEVNQPSNFGGVTLFTPLHLAAAWDGQPQVAELLLRHGADVNAVHEEYNATPLSTARYFKNPEVEAVIQAHIDLRATLMSGDSRPAPALSADLIRPFVPSSDWDLCKRFYQELGFAKTYDDGQGLAVFTLGEVSFYLQKGMWGAAHANYMLLLRVADADAWWRHVQPLAERYKLRVRPPQDEPWGARNLHLIDPSGILWHIAQFS